MQHAPAAPRKFGGQGRLVVEPKVELPKAPVPALVKPKARSVDEEEYDQEMNEFEVPAIEENEEEDPLDFPGNQAPAAKVVVLNHADRGVGLVPGQRVEMPRPQMNPMFPQAVVSPGPGLLGKHRNIIPMAKEPVKKLTKAGALGKCSCGVNITGTNKKQSCFTLTGYECNASYCITCLIGKKYCDTCKRPLTFLPKNNKIKFAAINQLSSTHSFTSHILSALPYNFLEGANNYLAKTKRILELTLVILNNKMGGNFLSEQQHSDLMDLEKSKTDFKKLFESIILKIKNDKMNLPCLDCPKGSLTKAGPNGDIKCNKCHKVYCTTCLQFQGHDGPCNNRAMLCPCGVLTAGSTNIFCLGCFTFYSEYLDLEGLCPCYVDPVNLPDAGNSLEFQGIRMDFIDSYELNRATLISYIDKYNAAITAKNTKLFWLFVENVMCGNEVASDHDKRIVEYSIIQADRNLLNKIEQLYEYMKEGLNQDDAYLYTRRIVINKLFATTIDKKPLIGEDIKFKVLPPKTKAKAGAIQEE